jgi:alkylation response protein AidB-like acyl-CoA dehydrogenase
LRSGTLDGPRRYGFLGVAIPESFGGAGADHLELCVIAQEMGRALAPVSFSSTVYLATEALLIAGSTEAEMGAEDRVWRAHRYAGAVYGVFCRFRINGRSR